jgi:RNA polymerase sigma-70 factor (ECF subfamily)
LSQLPDEQRSAITLAFFGGLTHEEVARCQAVPLGTAKTRIRLAMRRLRQLLGG